jgi:hypothetical protein
MDFDPNSAYFYLVGCGDGQQASEPVPLNLLVGDRGQSLSAQSPTAVAHPLAASHRMEAWQSALLRRTVDPVNRLTVEVTPVPWVGIPPPPLSSEIMSARNAYNAYISTKRFTP